MGETARPPLGEERYVNLETFRRDGSGVRTPVWVASVDGRLVIVTSGRSYKVRRLRREPRVRVVACDAGGRTRGRWYEGRGRILDDAGHAARAHAALRRKYGWQMLVLDVVARLTRRMAQRAYLEVTVGSSA